MSDNFTTPDDEIDVFELIETLWSEKILIAGITFVAGILSAVYAFIATPTFEAEIRLLPAEKTQLAQYNPVEYGALSDLGIPGLNPEGALKGTLDQIRSTARVTEFVKNRDTKTFNDQVELTEDELFEAVANLVSDAISISKDKNAPQTVINFQHSEAVESFRFLSDLITWAQLEVQEQRVLDIRNTIERKIEANLLQIERLTQTYERRLNEDLAVLGEALSIAIDLGITSNQSGVFVAEGQGRLQEANTLYLKGSNLLSAEIVALKERISDSRFLRQVRLLEEQNQTLIDLKAIELPVGEIVKIDKPASVPRYAIGPNKKLIIVLAIVLGGMCAVLYVLIRNAIRSRQINPRS